MSGKQVTGMLDTVVAVRFTDGNMDWGKWQTAPGATAAVGTSQLFVGVNRDSSSAGISGYASYVAADGTEFTFSFDDPASDANSCSSSMKNVSGNYSLPAPVYPQSGQTWTVTYKIANASSLFDAPVFSDDLIHAGRCDAFPESRIKEWVGDRNCIYLRDILSHSDVPVEGKIWCATHRLFLTPDFKTRLTRKLVRFAIDDSRNPSLISKVLLNDLLKANQDFALGDCGLNAISQLAHRFRTELSNQFQQQSRESEIVDVVSALLVPNANEQWENAVSSYLGRADGVIWLDRGRKLLEVIASEF